MSKLLISISGHRLPQGVLLHPFTCSILRTTRSSSTCILLCLYSVMYHESEPAPTRSESESESESE